jgi:dUTP pyrophosphatase
MIYLAHPLDFATINPLELSEIAMRLANMGQHVYRPGAAWTVDPTWLDSRVQEINRQALTTADAVVVYWPAGTHSVGCGVEIGEASMLQIPTLVIGQTPGFALVGTPTVTMVDVGDWDLIERWVEQLTIPRWETPELKVAGSGPLPERAHDDDAGFDLYCSNEDPIMVEPGSMVMVPCDVWLEWPQGMWALILGRSSTFANRQLYVPPSVIDAGYRGPMFVVCQNIGRNPITIAPHDRLVQAVPFPTFATGIETRRVDHVEMSETTRGEKGFGSSGY